MVSVVSCGKKTWAVKLVRNKLHGLIMAFNQEKVVLFQEYTRCDQHTYGASVYDSPFHTNDRNICESMHATNTLVVRCKNKTFYLHMHQKHTWNSNQQVQTEGHGCSTKHKFQINTGSSDRIWVEVRLRTPTYCQKCRIVRYVTPALFNRCERYNLGCTKICVGCTTKEGFTKVHHKLVTLNRHFLQNFLLAKMNH